MSQSKLDQYSPEILDALGGGESQRKIAKDFNVARSTLQHWLKNQGGSVAYNDHDELSEEPTEGGEIPVVFKDYSTQPELYLYPMGDVHKGAKGHARARWREWLKYLEDTPHASMLGTGDFFNAALKNSKSESYDEELTVEKAREELTQELAPLAENGRIDLLMPGNHEDRIYRAVGDCPVSAIASHLDVPYVREACLIVYEVGEVQYLVFTRHGTGGGGVGARANRLAKMATQIIADIYISGHTHSQLVYPQDVFRFNGESVERYRQLFVSSSSFVNYEGYASRAGFAPQKLGAPRIRLDGTRHDVHVSI